MTTQETISLVSASIAFLSLCANAVMAIALYKLNRRNLTHDDVLDALRALRQSLEATHYFDIDPEQEIWEFGFESLKNVNTASMSALIAVQSSRRVPVDVRAAVESMAAEVKRLRGYQDGWRSFRVNKTGDWREIQQYWPQLPTATKDLRRAQLVAADRKKHVSAYLANQ
jgi:hypothetical protein